MGTLILIGFLGLFGIIRMSGSFASFMVSIFALSGLMDTARSGVKTDRFLMAMQITCSSRSHFSTTPAKSSHSMAAPKIVAFSPLCASLY